MAVLLSEDDRYDSGERVAFATVQGIRENPLLYAESLWTSYTTWGVKEF